MSLEHLFTTKNAQFFRPNPRRRISKTAAAGIIKKVSAARTGKIQDKKVRESLMVDGSAVHLTYGCFPIESEPTFLVDSGLRETKYAYLLLVETSDTIAVFKRNVEGVMPALSPFILPWKYQELGGVYGADNPAFEKISLKTMSLAGHVVRRRSLEADNLAESMAIVELARDAGVPIPEKLRPHDLRRSFATNELEEKPLEYRRVLRSLGHTYPSSAAPYLIATDADVEDEPQGQSGC